MTVTALIDYLQKVQRKEAEVYLEDSGTANNAITDAVIEHDLLNDNVVVVLKRRPSTISCFCEDIRPI